jgi:RNA-directed DNA polymerase
VKRAGSLFEQVVSFPALRRAALRAARRKRAKPSTAAFLVDLESEVLALERELRSKTWVPRPFRTFSVSDPKPRTISAADFRDRVVHHALCSVLEPLFERAAIFDSYACRKDKGTHAAVLRAQTFSRRRAFYLKLDVRHFFETADHAVLKAQVRRRVKDRDLLWLVDTILDHGAPGSPPGRGLPIGNLTSQHLANHCLTDLDHFVKQDLRVREYLRYMDDLILLDDQKARLWEARDGIAGFLRDQLALALKEEVTLLAPVLEGLPFLGFRVWPSLIRLDPRAARRFRARMRDLQHGLEEGALSEEEAARSGASVVGHVAFANTMNFRRSFFGRLYADD